MKSLYYHLKIVYFGGTGDLFSFNVNISVFLFFFDKLILQKQDNVLLQVNANDSSGHH